MEKKKDLRLSATSSKTLGCVKSLRDSLLTEEETESREIKSFARGHKLRSRAKLNDPNMDKPMEFSRLYETLKVVII